MARTNDTPTKRYNGSDFDSDRVPPSPGSLALLYGPTKDKLFKLRAEDKELLKRLIADHDVNYVTEVVLEPSPLGDLYEILQELIAEPKPRTASVGTSFAGKELILVPDTSEDESRSISKP